MLSLPSSAVRRQSPPCFPILVTFTLTSLHFLFSEPVKGTYTYTSSTFAPVSIVTFNSEFLAQMLADLPDEEFVDEKIRNRGP